MPKPNLTDVSVGTSQVRVDFLFRKSSSGEKNSEGLKGGREREKNLKVWADVALFYRIQISFIFIVRV